MRWPNSLASSIRSLKFILQTTEFNLVCLDFIMEITDAKLSGNEIRSNSINYTFAVMSITPMLRREMKSVREIASNQNGLTIDSKERNAAATISLFDEFFIPSALERYCTHNGKRVACIPGMHAILRCQ